MGENLPQALAPVLLGRANTETATTSVSNAKGTALSAATSSDGHAAVTGADTSGTGGAGVSGTSANGTGVAGTTSGDDQHGVKGIDASTGGGFAVYGTSTSGFGVYGTSANGAGVAGESANATGASGLTYGDGQMGVHGVDASTEGGYGVYGRSDNGDGVYGLSEGNGFGVYGTSANGAGVAGTTSGNGQSGVSCTDASSEGNGYGVYGTSGSGSGVYGTSPGGTGVTGISTYGWGVQGSTSGEACFGVTGMAYAGSTGVHGFGDGDNSIGVYGEAIGDDSLALFAAGDARVTGNLSKGGGSFRIDHPLDPANKYLYHSFVESPDMMNVYNGNVILGSDGKATVELPDWFEVLNRDFRYQLTSIGSLDPTCISRKVSDGSFEIMGSPQQDVSWQVTGIRQDAWADAHRVPVEVEKKPADRGRYLHPELFGGEPIEEIARGRRYRQRLPHRRESA